MATVSKEVLRSFMFLVPTFLVLIFTAGLAAEQKTTRMTRMPLYYGKRSAQHSADAVTKTSEWYNSIGGFNRDSFLEHSSDIRHNEHYRNGGEPVKIDRHLGRDHPSLTSILCSIFRKPLHLRRQTDNAEMVKRGYSTLSRMPGYFGKRFYRAWEQDFTYPRSTEGSVKMESNFYGDRVKSNLELWNPENVDTIVLKRGSLRRMPAFYGKRAHPLFDSRSEYRNNFKTSSKMSHIQKLHSLSASMPRHSSSEYASQNDIVLDLLYLLGVAGVQDKVENRNRNRTGDSDSSVNTNKVDDRSDNIDDNAKEDYESSDDNSFPNGEKSSFEISKRRYLSTLDRMPHFFGKRGYVSYLDTPTYLQDTSDTRSNTEDTSDTRSNIVDTSDTRSNIVDTSDTRSNIVDTSDTRSNIVDTSDTPSSPDDSSDVSSSPDDSSDVSSSPDDSSDVSSSPDDSSDVSSNPDDRSHTPTSGNDSSDTPSSQDETSYLPRNLDILKLVALLYDNFGKEKTEMNKHDSSRSSREAFKIKYATHPKLTTSLLGTDIHQANANDISHNQVNDILTEHSNEHLVKSLTPAQLRKMSSKSTDFRQNKTVPGVLANGSDYNVDGDVSVSEDLVADVTGNMKIFI